MDTVYVIRWRRDLLTSYNYGSQILFRDNVVQFSNTIMSPGEKIHSWASTSVYNDKRWVPELPLLFSGQNYSFSFHFETDPTDSVHIGITFMDIHGEAIDNLVFTDLNATFTFPEEARGYEISLLNMSNKQLRFSYFTLGLKSVFPRLKQFSVDSIIDVHAFKAANEENAGRWNMKIIDASSSALTSTMYYGSENQSEIIIGVSLNRLNKAEDLKLLAKKVMAAIQVSLQTEVQICELEISEAINLRVPSFVSGIQNELRNIGGDK